LPTLSISIGELLDPAMDFGTRSVKGRFDTCPIGNWRR